MLSNEQLIYIYERLNNNNNIYYHIFESFPKEVFEFSEKNRTQTFSLTSESLMIYIPELNCMSCLQRQLSQLFNKVLDNQFENNQYIITRTENLNKITIFIDTFNIAKFRILLIDPESDFLINEESTIMFTVSLSNRIENVMKINPEVLEYNIRYIKKWGEMSSY